MCRGAPGVAAPPPVWAVTPSLRPGGLHQSLPGPLPFRLVSTTGFGAERWLLTALL
jgi:hypothetical protein